MQRLITIIVTSLAILVSCEYDYGNIVNNSDYIVSVETTRERKFELRLWGLRRLVDYPNRQNQGNAD
jgi:hypothetical protein